MFVSLREMVFTYGCKIYFVRKDGNSLEILSLAPSALANVRNLP